MTRTETKSNETAQPEASTILLKRILSITSIVLSIVSLYYKRKEKIALVAKKYLEIKPQASKRPPEAP